MKHRFIPLAASLFAFSISAWGQSAVKPDASPKMPAEPGMRGAPDSSTKSPANSGIVVVPPQTDQQSVAKPPKNVDPGMDDATGRIDRRNQQMSDPKKAGDKKPQ